MTGIDRELGTKCSIATLLRHTCENNMAESSSEKMASETADEEPFKTVPVKRKRKRGQVEDMDTSEASRRPSFPAAKAEKLMV